MNARPKHTGKKPRGKPVERKDLEKCLIRGLKLSSMPAHNAGAGTDRVDIMRLASVSFSVVFMAVLMGFAAQNAHAQDDENSIKKLLACDRIKNPEDKLECFNAAIEILKQEEDAKQQSADSDLLRERGRVNRATGSSSFGFTEEELARRAGKPDESRGPKQQVFQFTRAWRDAVGKYYFLMSNGQIWKEVKGSHLIVPKRAKKIRIKRNRMGGYIAFVEGMNGRQGRVKRVR